ncbi:hypothetical protein HDU87_006630 [Geranomyces variabilis]|uniref:RRM domain-containing protein n=1 Tax=Geranomyces variabilis TaxID=109894 RepID=A0AAD5TFK1_9FUNG|nr:hypothetical protein HDU87_006630 [Geranomyces variabilis]
MSDPMDVSLDDLIAQKRSKGGRSNGGGGGGRAPRQNSRSTRSRNNGDARKPYARGNAEADWSHDMFEGRTTANSTAAVRGAGRRGAEGPATLKLENLHWNVSEQDIDELMGAYGRVKSMNVKYDIAGRSLGVCFVTFESRKEAQAAADAYDGRSLDGMKLSATVLASRGESGGGAGSGGRLASRLGPKPGQSVLDRLGKKLEDRLGPKVPASAESLAYSNGVSGGRGGGGGGGGGGHTRSARQPRGKPTVTDLDAQMDRYMATGGAPEAEMDLDAAPAAAPVDWDKPAASATARGIITYDDIAQPQ